jgi:hypothetical protein
MRLKQRRWMMIIPATALATALVPTLASVSQAAAKAPAPAKAAAASSTRWTGLDCGSETHNFNCPDVYDPTAIGYGKYVGHDEPSELYYSNKKGSGNNNLYLVKLPKEPPVAPNQAGTGGTGNFELHPAFWFGMAMCDTQSFPEATQTCKADSDSNIYNSANPASPRYIGKHPGAAFMEMQFYPPGWVSWPPGVSCAATQWCAALNIDSYNSSPAGVDNNEACQDSVGVEPVNFAFITKNGHAQAPSNPVDATGATYTPDPAQDLFMNPGDVIAVSMHDTAAGFTVTLHDFTTHRSGSMTAGPANGFGQVLYQPNSTTCNVAPYAFHPMYSTSSTATRVPWTAHTYNVAFADEIGHFEFCNAVDTTTGNCTSPGVNDPGGLDSDDVGCFPAADSLLVPVSGCIGSDGDFDGPPYLNDWPGTGSPRHDAKYDPQPITFTTPRFNGGQRYSQVAFEADLPRIEYPDFGGNCNGATGAGCVNPPPGSQFYPIFSTTYLGGHSQSTALATAGRHDGGRSCVWRFGGPKMPRTARAFGGSSATEYSQNLVKVLYPSVNGSGQPAPEYKYEDFRNILRGNPC